MRFPTYKVTFESLGEPDLYVMLRDPASLPWGYMKKLAKTDDPNVLEDLFKRLIIEWNLTFEDSPNILPLPSQEPEVLDQLETGILMYLVEEVNRRAQVSKR